MTSWSNYSVIQILPSFTLKYELNICNQNYKILRRKSLMINSTLRQKRLFMIYLQVLLPEALKYNNFTNITTSPIRQAHMYNIPNYRCQLVV